MKKTSIITFGILIYSLLAQVFFAFSETNFRQDLERREAITSTEAPSFDWIYSFDNLFTNIYVFTNVLSHYIAQNLIISVKILSSMISADIHLVIPIIITLLMYKCLIFCARQNNIADYHIAKIVFLCSSPLFILGHGEHFKTNLATIALLIGYSLRNQFLKMWTTLSSVLLHPGTILGLPIIFSLHKMRRLSKHTKKTVVLFFFMTTFVLISEFTSQLRPTPFDFQFVIWLSAVITFVIRFNFSLININLTWAFIISLIFTSDFATRIYLLIFPLMIILYVADKDRMPSWGLCCLIFSLLSFGPISMIISI